MMDSCLLWLYDDEDDSARGSARCCTSAAPHAMGTLLARASGDLNNEMSLYSHMPNTTTSILTTYCNVRAKLDSSHNCYDTYYRYHKGRLGDWWRPSAKRKVQAHHDA